MRGAVVDIGPESRDKIRDWLALAALRAPDGYVRLTLTSRENKIEAPNMETLKLEEA